VANLHVLRCCTGIPPGVHDQPVYNEDAGGAVDEILAPLGPWMGTQVVLLGCCYGACTCVRACYPSRFSICAPHVKVHLTTGARLFGFGCWISVCHWPLRATCFRCATGFGCWVSVCHWPLCATCFRCATGHCVPFALDVPLATVCHLL